jgi:hypothetical protein
MDGFILHTMRDADLPFYAILDVHYLFLVLTLILISAGGYFVFDFNNPIQIYVF